MAKDEIDNRCRGKVPMKKLLVVCAFALAPTAGLADSSTLDAAIGGGLGGAAGAAIGNEIGGREGAIIGGAIGGGAGAAVATDSDARNAPSKDRQPEYHSYPAQHPGGTFCPPGQAKKGRC